MNPLLAFVLEVAAISGPEGDRVALSRACVAIGFDPVKEADRLLGSEWCDLRAAPYGEHELATIALRDLPMWLSLIDVPVREQLRPLLEEFRRGVAETLADSPAVNAAVGRLLRAAEGN